LIKVKIATEDRETKTLIVEAIVRETGACNVQVIGKTLVLYRPTKERKISLPR
ncbi:ribosome assembly RNA-binding protein YhbY, partial [Shigella sonnei]|nr:ribosome assembly RNA-binding protein YhbY [Shigella sonnei]